MADSEPFTGPPDNLFDWVRVQFMVSDLLERGEITQSEAWWYKKGWIPATHGSDELRELTDG